MEPCWSQMYGDGRGVSSEGHGMGKTIAAPGGPWARKALPIGGGVMSGVDADRRGAIGMEG